MTSDVDVFRIAQVNPVQLDTVVPAVTGPGNPVVIVHLRSAVVDVDDAVAEALADSPEFIKEMSHYVLWVGGMFDMLFIKAGWVVQNPDDKSQIVFTENADEEIKQVYQQAREHNFSIAQKLAELDEQISEYASRDEEEEEEENEEVAQVASPPAPPSPPHSPEREGGGGLVSGDISSEGVIVEEPAVTESEDVEGPETIAEPDSDTQESSIQVDG